MDTNLIIAKEAFFARLMPLCREVAFDAERGLHAANYGTHALVAGVAALVASLLLFGLGRWFRHRAQLRSGPELNARFSQLEAGARHWLYWLLILSPMPIGSALIIAAGFFRLRPALAGTMIVLAEIFWRASPLLNN